jgi:hypothetical protein
MGPFRGRNPVKPARDTGRRALTRLGCELCGDVKTSLRMTQWRRPQ